VTAALRYPIYIPSKERAGVAPLPDLLAAAGVPYRLAVDPPDVEAYTARYGAAAVFPLPPAGVGSIFAARDAIRADAAAGPATRHWQLDDDIRQFLAWTDGRRQPCDPIYALGAVEAFADRHTNIGVAGPAFSLWAFRPRHALRVNGPVVCALLIDNALPCRFRGPCSEDLDFNLQALAAGHCTVVLQTVQFVIVGTMTQPGGMRPVYSRSDGRLRLVRDLERRWPGVVTTRRVYGEPRPHIAWRKFDTPLRPCSDA
jgi:hypothetical protein